MLKNLNFNTRLGAATTSTLIVSAFAPIASVVLIVAGAAAIAAAVSVLALLVVAAGALIANTRVAERDDQIDEAVAAADELAMNRLPRLTGSLLDDDDLSGFDDFPGESDEGVGRIVRALNALQAQSRNAALEQRTQVREGVSNLVINLVRRNQGLLERQLFHIDRLESTEEDPDRLEDLYGIDHLASRMRRNAESLLVLAGLDPQRRKGDPISINDLMRVAMGEIEGYQNVRIVRVDDGDVSAQAALDIAHLLSELLENATQFSPPTATVELAGRSQSDGSYLISISDAGIGMSHDQLDQYNRLLSDPPELSLGLSRSLGFLVVGRLAQRLGVTVELAPAEVGAGVAALVLVPGSLLGGETPPAPPALETPAEPGSERSDDALPFTDGDDPQPVGDPLPSAEPTASVVPGQLGSTSDDDEPAWVPPQIPQRGTGGLGAPADPADTGPEPAAPVEHQPVGAHATPTARPQSEALAKLLGIDPRLDAPDAAPSGTGRSERAEPGRDSDLGALPADGAVPDPPAPELTTFEPVDDERPQRLEEAIPSGDHFDAGVAGLLVDSDNESPRIVDRPSDEVPGIDAAATDPAFDDEPFGGTSIDSTTFDRNTFDSKTSDSTTLDGTTLEGTTTQSNASSAQLPGMPPQRTSKGLTKRDRSKSSAPIGEGRVIPDATNSVAASTRDPEEIRDMLARYRKAREGTNPDGSADRGGAQ